MHTSTIFFKSAILISGIIFFVFSVDLYGISIKKEKKSNAGISDEKIDSVLWNLVRENNLDYKTYYRYSNGIWINDTTDIRKIFPLVKKVYYPTFDITFEFRQSSDYHDILELVLCYNDSICCGIPFRDNYYYWKFHGDESKYIDKLSFEKKLNNAIAEFQKNREIPIYLPYFIDAVMGNLTTEYCREIFPGIGDFEAVKKEYKNNKSFFSISPQKAISNVKKIEKEVKNDPLNNIVYYFYLSNVIYYFKCHDKSEDGKYVNVEVVNKECYFQLIF